VTSFAKRDALRKIELEMQAEWDKQHMFELDAPTSAEERLTPKYMVTFPYPYMNGRLHLGHTFTLAKCEFAVGYERLKGKKAIFPFGFHCTGMPIKAAADKLAYEMETYGNPPVFPPVPDTLDIRIFAHDPEKKKKGAKSKKAKAASKSAAGKFQWQIMKNSDVPEAEIPKFAQGEHWVKYFPPLAINDLKRMGAKIDWRRSFITTDLNPYYDSFVRWQFNRLRAAGKVQFGKRNTIYSPRDKGACMDHERASGEGVTPTEFTIVKQELLKPYPVGLAALEKIDKKVYLIPATLRPETMYVALLILLLIPLTIFAHLFALKKHNTTQHNTTLENMMIFFMSALLLKASRQGCIVENHDMLISTHPPRLLYH
jgi:leucyl-tRNA synthetase